MKTNLYNKEGKKNGTVDVSDRVFKVDWNNDLVAQALRVQEANRRLNLAHAKGRSDVRGGGRKPWRQKGTGRARHGSIRSPIWVGGGVAHGPIKEKSFSLRLNKKMRQKAIFAILSRRLNEEQIKVVESLELESPKTKELSDVLTKLGVTGSALLVVAPENKNVFRASRNLPRVKVSEAKSLNVFDLLRPAAILIEKGALDVIDTHYHALK